MKTKFRIILSLPDLISMHCFFFLYWVKIKKLLYYVMLKRKISTSLDAELTLQIYFVLDITIITIRYCHVEGDKWMFNFQF